MQVRQFIIALLKYRDCSLDSDGYRVMLLRAVGVEGFFELGGFC